MKTGQTKAIFVYAVLDPAVDLMPYYVVRRTHATFYTVQLGVIVLNTQMSCLGEICARQ